MYDLRRLPISHYAARWLAVLVLCLCLVPLAHAAKKIDFGGQHVQRSGNVARFGSVPSQGSTFIPGSKPNLSGWYSAGNYGVAPSATGPTMNMGINGDVFFSGTKYPFQAGYSVPKANIWNAVKSLSGGPIGLGIFTVASIAEWLDNANVRFDDGQFYAPSPDACTFAPCYSYRAAVGYPYFPTPTQAAQSQVGRTNVGGCGTILTAWATGIGLAARWHATCTAGSISNVSFSVESRAPDGSAEVLVDLDDIGPYMDTPEVPQRVIQDLLDRGADIQLPAPTVTGPSTVVGPKQTTVNPDGSRVERQQTSHFTNSGNTVTNTHNTTNIVNYDVNNNIISTTTETTEAPETQDQCAANPNSAGCAELDTPTEEVPRETRTITYQQENHFGGGSCPADLVMTLASTGQSMTVWDWQHACDKIGGPFRAVFLVCCAFVALLILAPGVREA